MRSNIYSCPWKLPSIDYARTITMFLPEEEREARFEEVSEGMAQNRICWGRSFQERLMKKKASMGYQFSLQIMPNVMTLKSNHTFVIDISSLWNPLSCQCEIECKSCKECSLCEKPYDLEDCRKTVVCFVTNCIYDITHCVARHWCDLYGMNCKKILAFEKTNDCRKCCLKGRDKTFLSLADFLKLVNKSVCKLEYINADVLPCKVADQISKGLNKFVE